MAQFINPFPGNVPDRLLSARELTRAIRQALAAEEEAVHLYEAIADATDDERIKKLMQSVADEERVHAGEFHAALERLLPDEVELMTKGRKETAEFFEEKKASVGVRNDLRTTIASLMRKG
jgi:rubrerythrin